MSTKPAPNFGLEVDGGDSELFTNGRESLVTPEKPTPTTVYFYPLPNYEQNRQHDPRSRDNVNKHQTPYKSGWLERFEQTAEPGWYFVEFRTGNRMVPGGEPYEVKPKGSIGEVSRMQTTQAGTAQPAPVESAIAQPMVQARDLLRAAKDFVQEAAPPAPAVAPMTAADIQKMVADGVRDALAQSHHAQEQHSQFELVQKLEEMADLRAERERQMRETIRAEVAAMMPKENTQSNSEPGDQLEGMLSLHERLLDFGAKINPNGEGRSRWDSALDTIKSAAEAAPAVLPLIIPILPARLRAMLQGAGATDATPAAEQPQATQPPQQPQAARAQPTAPQDENEAMVLIAHVAVADLVRNKRVGRAADLIEDMVTRFPTLAPMLKQLFESQPTDILAALGQFVGRDDLASFRHSSEWVLDLMDELLPEDGDEGEPEELQQPSDAPSTVRMASPQMQ